MSKDKLQRIREALKQSDSIDDGTAPGETPDYTVILQEIEDIVDEELG